MPGSIGNQPMAAGTEAVRGDVNQRVRRYIIDNLLLGTDDELDDQASLLDAGILDSTGAMELVAFLEEQFGVTVRDDELIPDNLDSVTRLSDFIIRKQTVPAGRGSKP